MNPVCIHCGKPVARNNIQDPALLWVHTDGYYNCDGCRTHAEPIPVPVPVPVSEPVDDERPHSAIQGILVGIVLSLPVWVVVIVLAIKYGLK
jgi:hypothetical protein